jgi:mRNA-degrading endonuclease RelE of RelBE toxin-antitoxin system
MSYKVKTIPKFEKELKRLAKKYYSLKKEFIELVESLKEHPEQGTPLGNNCYKIRLSIASKQKGKSGGARVITYVQVLETPLYICLQSSIRANKKTSRIKTWNHY